MPNEIVTATFRAQRGLITRNQALAAGLSAAAIGRRLDAGSWERLHPTVYRLNGTPTSWHQRCLAATLWQRRGGRALLARECALHLWALGDGMERPVRPELLVDHGSRDRSGVVEVERTTWLPSSHATTRFGIPVTSVERSLLDCAALLSRARLTRCVESAVRLRHTDHGRLAELVVAPEARGRAGINKLIDVLDERAPGGGEAVELGLEEATWDLLRSSGLPLPTRQAPIVVDGIDWTVDFYWSNVRVALESDGYAAHQSLTAFRQDRRKMRALASAGVTVLPVTWDDVTRAADRLMTDIERALRRAGREV